MPYHAPPANVVIAPAVFRCGTFALALALATACNDAPRPASASAPPANSPATKSDDSSVGAIDLGRVKYREATITAMGSVAGTIRSAIDTTSLDSTTTPDFTSTSQDTMAASAPEAPDCEQKVVATRPTKTPPFANSIVWIAGLDTGKALPIEKRADLSSEKCVLDPRVQAVIVGTTMNVINDEKVLHKLVFTKLGTRDPLAVTPFFNAGQMVATERLAKSTGVVEVRCARHPWTRAYIAVFDHPYFSVTERNGRFKIDSLPPGNYSLMIWAPGDAKPLERKIQITAGGETRVDLK